VTGCEEAPLSPCHPSSLGWPLKPKPSPFRFFLPAGPVPSVQSSPVQLNSVQTFSLLLCSGCAVVCLSPCLCCILSASFSSACCRKVNLPNTSLNWKQPPVQALCTGTSILLQVLLSCLVLDRVYVALSTAQDMFDAPCFIVLS